MANISSALMNQTLIEDVAIDGVQHASGQTILWALVALALTAMSQTSKTAEYLGVAVVSFGHDTSPHRISPIFCLFDTLFDLWLAVRAVWLILQSRQARAPTAVELQQVVPASSSDDQSNPTRGSISEMSDSEGCNSITTLPPSDVVDTITPAAHIDNGASTSDGNAGGVAEGSLSEASSQSLGSAGTSSQLAANDAVATPRDDAAIADLVSAMNTLLQVRAGDAKPDIPSSSDDFLEALTYCLTGHTDDEGSDHKTKTLSSAVYCMKLSLLVLGALPQSVKICAIQGVPFTQTIAATYLTAIITHGLRSFLQTFAPVEHSSKEYVRGKYWARWRKQSRIRDLLTALHFGIYSYLWYEFVGRLQIPPGKISSFTYEIALVANVVLMTLMFAALPAMAFLLPALPPDRRQIETWFHWIYAIQSTVALIMQLQPGHSAWRDSWHRVYALVGWKGITAVQAYTYMIPTTIPPMLLCIGLAQLMRWSFMLLSQLRNKTDVESDDAHELLPRQEKNAEEKDLISALQKLFLESPNDRDQGRARTAFGRLRTSRSWTQYLAEVIGRGGSTLCAILTPCVFVAHVAEKWFGKVHAEVQWTAFIFFNVITATLWYTIIFDGSSTIQPGWTAVLG